MSSATLNGQANSHDFPISAYFEWGLTTDYGFSTPIVEEFGKNSGLVPFSLDLTGLSHNTTYHYRAVINYFYGKKYGADQSFTTLVGGNPHCGTGDMVKIDGYVDGLFGTYAKPSFSATANICIPGVGPLVVDSNPRRNYYPISDLNFTSSGYAKTTGGLYVSLSGGINTGRYYQINFCTGAADREDPPTFPVDGLGQAPYYAPDIARPWGGSSLPAWDGSFPLTDDTGGSLCSSQDYTCSKSLGGLDGMAITLFEYDVGQFVLDISANHGGIASGIPELPDMGVMWEGTLTTPAFPADPDCPLGVYTFTGFGDSVSPPATITLVSA